MSEFEITRTRCKNVICTLESRLKDEGDNYAPILVDLLKRNPDSTYIRSFTGLKILNFKRINQQLDEKECSVNDFVEEVQTMLKGVADQFGMSCEVVAEVETIHAMFFDLMERTFVDMDFAEARSAVKFTNDRPKVYLLSQGGRKRNKSRRGDTGAV